jgi:hypothetical protein
VISFFLILDFMVHSVAFSSPLSTSSSAPTLVEMKSLKFINKKKPGGFVVKIKNSPFELPLRSLGPDQESILIEALHAHFQKMTFDQSKNIDISRIPLFFKSFSQLAPGLSGIYQIRMLFDYGEVSMKEIEDLGFEVVSIDYDTITLQSQLDDASFVKVEASDALSPFQQWLSGCSIRWFSAKKS